jgi:hypothetical protein
VYGVSTEAFLDCVLSGLQIDIKRDVMALSPTNIQKVVALAKLFEEKYAAQPKIKYPQHSYKGPNPNSIYPSRNNPTTCKTDPPTNTHPPKTSLPPLLPTPNQKPMSIKNISPAEMQIRRDKGLCYFCDEKFSHAHRCPNRRLMMLQLTKEDEEETQDPDPPDDLNQGFADDDNQHHLSLNAMKGNNGVGTIRFTGRVGNIDV